MKSPVSWLRLILGALALLGGAAGLASAANDVYDVGVARVDVTPGYPIRLNGFGFRRDESEGVTHRIWVKALAIGGDEAGPAILFAIDSTGVRETMIDKVAARLKEKAGIDRERIAATFTHTHTAPKLNGVCDTVFSTPISTEHQAHIDRYDMEVTDALEKAALAALADRKPARLQWGVGQVGFAANRRTPGGPVDHSLPMLVVRAVDDDAIRAVYVTYACHCVTLSNNKISGDWAGFAQQAIESKHPGAVALVSIGCGSDSNPTSGVTGDNTAAAADQGAQIADEVDRLLAGPLKPIVGSLATTLNHVEIPLNPVPSRDELKQIAAKGGPEGYNADFQLARLDRDEPLVNKLDYPIQTWAFGNSLAMVFLAGEVCVDYSLRLKAELDPARVWLHGYANDFCAYIPSERLLKEGGYGGGAEVVYFVLPTTLATGLEETIIAEVHRQVPKQFEGNGPRQGARAQPWPLAEALASIRVKPGFVVEIAAAEPLVADPVAIDFAADGRLWVADMTDYTRNVDEPFEQSGSVRLLTDRDGDGRYDDSAIFQAGLRFPTDVKAWGAGVIVCDAPDVIYLEDADGDGRADVRKVLLTGFETHNAQARVNSLRWGVDNWLYGSCGLFGGKIKTFAGHEIDLGARDFRFRPDTGELEPVTGKTQQGRARDDWGNWFGCENGSLLDHYPLVDRYLARNPRIAPPPAEVFVPAGDDPNQLHPIGAPTLMQLSGPPGRPTSVCGLDFYRDDLLGAEYANNAFVAEPVNQLVHRRILSPHGATFRGARAADEVDVEFLASTDPWFRPVQIRTGLDGCLYIVDMHRAVIEHPKFIPEQTLRELNPMAGRNQGRIFRIRRTDVAPRPIARLDHLNPAGLVTALDSPNGPQRDMAQQLLLARRAVDVAPQLARLVRRATRPASRLQALGALEGLGALEPELLVAALGDADPAVRRHAIRLSELFAATSPALADALLQLVDDADPQVQVQLASSLGELRDQRAAQVLARIAWRGHADPYLLASVWSGVHRGNVGNVIESIFQQAAADEVPAALLDPSIILIVELGSSDDRQQFAAALNVGADGPIAAWRLDAAALLLEASRAGTGDASSHSVDMEQELAPMIVAAQKLLEEGGGVEHKQLAALRILMASEENPEKLVVAAAKLLGPQSTPAVQQAAVDLMAVVDSPGAGQQLLDYWNGYTPATRAAAFDAIIGRPALLATLLERLTGGELRPADFDALQRQRLLLHADEAIREQAAAALAGAIDSNRQQIVENYAAEASEGDAGRGRKKFAAHCASCHKLEGQGYEVGPDLAALTSRTGPALIESILDPNRAVDERFRSYAAVTVDGLAHAGILLAETSTSITLVEQEGKTRTLLRSDLEMLQNTGLSLMPEGFERDLTPPDAADIVAYLMSVGPKPKHIDGNTPAIVAADENGVLWLLAANAEIFGQQITFEPPYRNIGFWHAQTDHVAWSVAPEHDGVYDVYLDWACADESAGNALIVEGGEEPVRWSVSGTGVGYDKYRTERIGQVRLREGGGRIVVRPEGPLTKVNLLDLRGVYLAPQGAPAEKVLATGPPLNGRDAATAIAELLVGLPVGTAGEYERIPKIWEQAIAAGKRNDAQELRRLIDLALPHDDEPLADWQTVVLGGGVVNGLSQSGEWPQRRVAELLGDRPDLKRRWDRALDLAVAKADDVQVRVGTRYDALRMLGAGDFAITGQPLLHYLGPDVDHELQMGAVSALADVDSPVATAELVKSIPNLGDGNRQLALEALLRTAERAAALRDALRERLIPESLFTSEQLGRLTSTVEQSDR